MADVIEITAEVRERELRLTSIPMMPSGSRNHLRIWVAFDAEWEGTTKTLVAYRDLAHPYHVSLGMDGTALIPHEVLAEQGVVYLGVFGIAGDQRITSTIVRYGVNEGAITDGLTPSDPTPEMWEQLIAAVNEARQAAESAMRDAQTAAQGAHRSEQAAAGSAKQADGAATRAETAADTATTSARDAETAKTEAQTAQRAAAQSAADAQQAAARAEQAAGNLSTAVTQVQNAAQAAQQSATQAQGHAKSAGDSAASAAQAQRGAADAESAARQTAAQAQSAQETATQAATEAGESARQAAGAQTAAQNSATAAGQQANAAATSAQQAQESQTAAEESAASAQASAAEATKQARASEASAVRAETAATEVEQSAQQIAGAIDRLAIHETAAGNPVVIRDSADWQMEGLRVYGQSEQAGVPSPESPQEIVSKTVDEIAVTGANLINQPTLSFAHFTKIGLERPLYPGIYTFSGVATTEAESDALLISCLDDAGKLVVSVYLPVGGRKHHAVTVTRQVVALQIYAARNNAQAIGKTAKIEGMQIELGTTPTPYEPYHAQTVTLSAPVTLRGVPVKTGGNVTINGQMYAADRIVERDGAVGVERWTKRLELPVADMTNSESSPGWNRKGFTENLSNPVYSMSTHLPKNAISLNFKYDILFFHASGLTQSEWKSKHPDVVIGAVVTLEAPTFEPLPETDQQAIRALRTYHGNTVVTAGAHSEVDYIADPKLYIDNKVNTLVTAYMQSIPVTIPLLDEEVVDNGG